MSVHVQPAPPGLVALLQEYWVKSTPGRDVPCDSAVAARLTKPKLQLAERRRRPRRSASRC